MLRDLVAWPAALEALEGYLLDGFDPGATSARSRVEVAHGQVLLMPCEGRRMVGVKVATVAPGNPSGSLPRVQGLYVLFDAATLTVLGTMDGAGLTNLRTPAVSALAVRHLTGPRPLRMVVFGTGPQAAGHVAAIEATASLDSVTVVGRDATRVESFVAGLVDSGLSARPGNAGSVEEADLVVCATTSCTPLFDGRMLGSDACVVAVGSHEPECRELDEHTFARADRVVVETPAVAQREAGDVVLALATGVIDSGELIGLSDAVHLEPAAGIGVFKSVGMGWQDLAVAELAFDCWSGHGRD